MALQPPQYALRFDIPNSHESIRASTGKVIPRELPVWVEACTGCAGVLECRFDAVGRVVREGVCGRGGRCEVNVSMADRIAGVQGRGMDGPY